MVLGGKKKVVDGEGPMGAFDICLAVTAGQQVLHISAQFCVVLPA